MGYIQVEKIVDVLVDPLRHSLRDKDPYVRKTAATCVAKLYMYDRVLVESERFVDMLRDLLADPNPTVRHPHEQTAEGTVKLIWMHRLWPMLLLP